MIFGKNTPDEQSSAALFIELILHDWLTPIYPPLMGRVFFNSLLPIPLSPGVFAVLALLLLFLLSGVLFAVTFSRGLFSVNAAKVIFVGLVFCW